MADTKMEYHMEMKNNNNIDPCHHKQDHYQKRQMMVEQHYAGLAAAKQNRGNLPFIVKSSG